MDASLMSVVIFNNASNVLDSAIIRMRRTNTSCKLGRRMFIVNHSIPSLHPQIPCDFTFYVSLKHPRSIAFVSHDKPIQVISETVQGILEQHGCKPTSQKGKYCWSIKRQTQRTKARRNVAKRRQIGHTITKDFRVSSDSGRDHVLPNKPAWRITRKDENLRETEREKNVRT